MDFNFFENDIFCQNFSKTFKRIFQKYLNNISPKVVTKVIKNQVGEACVILFTFNNERTKSLVIQFF
jgi:hypothetical protein